MSKLEAKLHDLSCRRGRREFLASLSPEIRSVFESCPTDSSDGALKFIVFPKWNNGVLSTTRENVEDWHREEFPSWESAKEAFLNFNLPGDKIGWLSFDFSGMHYEMSGKVLCDHRAEILDLLVSKNGGYRDLSWVGKNEDFGIALEYNSGQENEFELYWWKI